MDQGRKRVFWICAAIIAASRLAVDDGKNERRQSETIYDAILKAEHIIVQIDSRWSANRIP